MSLLVICAAPLAGCVTEPDPWLATGGVTAVASAGVAAVAGVGNRSIPPALAWASIAGINEKPLSARSLTGDGTRIQQVIYPNRTTFAGENMLTIEKGPASLLRLRNAPTRALIATEMKSAIHNLPMVMDTTLRRNAFGPFGVASGPLPGGGFCIFAWQTIDRWPESAGKEIVSVRLRHCDPSASRESLLSLLTTLSPSQGVPAYLAAETRAPTATVADDLAPQVASAVSPDEVDNDVALASRVTSKVDDSSSRATAFSIPLPNS
ncbi:MAG: cellulose biosynthesis protein BcsN [Allorhizobium sp.]